MCLSRSGGDAAHLRRQGRVLGLPLLIADRDGNLREPFRRIGAVRVSISAVRRRHRYGTYSDSIHEAGQKDGFGFGGFDFGNFGSVFAQTLANSPFDFNADGTVDGTDFAQFGVRFGVTL